MLRFEAVESDLHCISMQAVISGGLGREFDAIGAFKEHGICIHRANTKVLVMGGCSKLKYLLKTTNITAVGCELFKAVRVLADEL